MSVSRGYSVLCCVDTPGCLVQDLDDENIIETVDFSEFEKLFQLKKATKKEARKKAESESTCDLICTTLLPYDH